MKSQNSISFFCLVSDAIITQPKAFVKGKLKINVCLCKTLITTNSFLSEF